MYACMHACIFLKVVVEVYLLIDYLYLSCRNSQGSRYVKFVLKARSVLFNPKFLWSQFLIALFLSFYFIDSAKQYSGWVSFRASSNCCMSSVVVDNVKLKYFRTGFVSFNRGVFQNDSVLVDLNLASVSITFSFILADLFLFHRRVYGWR